MFLISLLLLLAPASDATRKISVAEYEARVYASWLGQCVGNIYGLPHENAYIDTPGPETFPYGYTRNAERLRQTGGAFSDDDTDLEYMYLLAMEAYGPEPSYAQLAERWKRHVHDRVWLANRAALALMREGFTPPVTGRREWNPHWFQIDPQLINEIWAVTAPGMVRYAAEKSHWAARVMTDGFGVEPTIHYGAMYAAAFFEPDVAKLVDIGTAALPPGSRFALTVEHMKAFHRRYPDDWKKARAEMAARYYREEPADTKTIWNANLNGAAGILALLYGAGDFQKTLDLACAMGFDADNQAATMAGLVALARGLEAIPRELLFPFPDLGWKLPLNDVYKNVTREDMPDASLRDQARRMARQGEAIVLAHGGRRVSEGGIDMLVIDPDAGFAPRLELPVGPTPALEVGRTSRFELPVVAPAGALEWSLESGRIPPGFSLVAGRLEGTATEAGVFDATVRVRRSGEEARRAVRFVVRGPNLAPTASRVLASVAKTDTAKRDAMWLSVPRSLYAENVDVIRDGVLRGDGSTFYSITTDDAARTDYYGYEWKEPQRIGLLAYHSGAVEENGGWFTSLGVEYRDALGAWAPVRGLRIEPPLPPGNEPFDKPHFVERLLTFEPVRTTAVRIVGAAGGAPHWHSKPTFFTSISELGAHGALSPPLPLGVPDSGREGVPDRWWEKAAAMVRVSPRGQRPFPIEDPVRLEAALDGLLVQGITTVEVFAPAEGGRSFGGLDTIDRYRLEPAAGTMDDFRRLVRLAHARNMAVISFDNLGYSSVEAVEFLKAADDVREGRATREASFFVWSDSKDAPPPGEAADRVFFVRPTHLPGGKPGTFYESSKHEYWEWSERARKFYWTKWGGEDRLGRKVRLPQYDWRSPAFQEEAEKIVRFWMDTGIDGMVIDAVNWYIGCTWEMSRRRMTDVIASYGNAYAQPEGAGAFREDPVAWVTEGGWNSVQDYGLGIWWEAGTNVIKNAIDRGDPRPIEAALRSYHDRVVEAGGSLYYQPTDFDDEARRDLAFATLASLGSLIQVEYQPDRPLSAEARWLLKTKAAHPALHQRSTRRHLPTLADDKHYAFLRTPAGGGGERVLVVLNFQKEAQEVAVDLSGVAAAALVDLKTGERFAPGAMLRLSLAGFGYRLLAVAPATLPPPGDARGGASPARS